MKNEIDQLSISFKKLGKHCHQQQQQNEPKEIEGKLG